MPDDLLDRPLDQLVGLPHLDEAWARTSRRARRRHAIRRAGAGLVAVGAVAAGLLVGTSGGGDDEIGVATQPAPEPTQQPPGTWEQLPSVPTGGVVDPTLLATSDGVILWTDLVPGAAEPWDSTTGLSYDAQVAEWADLRQQRASASGGTWVGGLLVDAPEVISGPGTVISRLTADGVWRAFAETTGQCANGRNSASEHELYVSCTDGAGVTTSIRALDVTVDVPYDVDAPQSGAWRELPPTSTALQNGQLVWAGDRLLVFGVSPEQQVVLSYDPSTDRWEDLPTPPLEDPDLRVAWTGTELLALDGVHAAAWSPDDGAWRRLPDVPQTEDGCVVFARAAAGRALAQTCHHVAVLDAEDEWQQVDLPSDAAILASAGGEGGLWTVAEGGTFWTFTP
jgi:hypothetical protein